MDILSSMMTEKLIHRNIIDPEKSEIYKTGFMLILADIINFSMILAIGVLTKSILWSLIYIIMMLSVRRLSGGFHAKTYGMCRLFTVGIYSLILITGKVINDHFMP